MEPISHLKMPRAVWSGAGALEQLPQLLAAEGAKRVAVFADKGIVGAGLLARPLELLEAQGSAYTVLDDLPPEPTYTQAQQVIDACKALRPELILAAACWTRPNWPASCSRTPTA